jgi:hypothetical protein
MAFLKIILGVVCLIVSCYSLLLTRALFCINLIFYVLQNSSFQILLVILLLFPCYLLVNSLLFPCYSLVIFRVFLDIKLAIVPNLICAICGKRFLSEPFFARRNFSEGGVCS